MSGPAAFDVDRWQRTFAIPGRVTLAQPPLGGPVVELSAPGGRAVVALQGAQVLSWRHAIHGEVLWCSPVARLGTAKPVRGGVPVCWPWFASAPVGVDGVAGWPQHGLVRTRRWRTLSTVADEARAEIVLGIDVSPGQQAGMAPEHGVPLPVWPGTAEAMLGVTLTDRLDIALTTRNTGAEHFAMTGALHTYLGVGALAGPLGVHPDDGVEFRIVLLDARQEVLEHFT